MSLGLGDGGFEDAAFLFSCDNRNRGILRMNFDEAAVMWKAVRATEGALLEIGRRHGGSTALLALASGSRKITSIDIAPAHHPRIEALFSLPETANRLELIVGDSRRQLSGHRFGFALIDGDHSLDGVLEDVAAHWSELHGFERILCAFHDAVPNPGLKPTPEGASEVEELSRRHADQPGDTNHYIGVECVCAELVASGAAEEWARAGSMLVLRKFRELPGDFRVRVRERMRAWLASPGP